jgi:hypothetical protein
LRQRFDDLPEPSRPPKQYDIDMSAICEAPAQVYQAIDMCAGACCAGRLQIKHCFFIEGVSHP